MADTFTTVRPPYNFAGDSETDLTEPPLLDADGEAIRRELKTRSAG